MAGMLAKPVLPCTAISALSLLFGRLARFAGFEGRCVTWCGFVVAATLIGFTR